MPGEFLNTYHFVPVLDGGPTTGPTHDLAPVRQTLEDGQACVGEWGPWSHARWHEGHLSGRITCTVTTEDPMVIGAEQTPGKAKTDCTVVKPYLLDGKPAIPPTTLKGMLSSIVEAATNSAMRVLHNDALSVWVGGRAGRRRELGLVHDYVISEARPLHPGRNTLSPAELMFGVVEVRQGGRQDKDPDSMALKGRVRCSAAVWNGEGRPFLTAAPTERLKILASPKPKGPVLYYRPRIGLERFIAKDELDANEHMIRGRKMYLHPSQSELTQDQRKRYLSHTPNNDSSNNQRNKVRSIGPGATFSFHVDFDDLPPEALDLLLFACRPTEAFRHKIGMGKPLGLGRVSIDVTGVEIIDRVDRYAKHNPFKEARVHKQWPGETGDDTINPAKAARRVIDQMDHRIVAHLLGIGEPRHVADRPVHPPYTNAQQAAFLANEALAERDAFKWFSNVYDPGNRQNQQWLRDITMEESAELGDDPGASIRILPLATSGRTPAVAAPIKSSTSRDGEITGTVRFYKDGRGYMIRDDGKDDIRLEDNVVVPCVGALWANMRIAVTIGSQKKGNNPIATWVRRLDR